MAGNASVRNRIGVGRAGNVLAVGEGINSLEHVRLRPMVWPEVAMIRRGVSRRILTAVMALHAQAAFTRVGDNGTVHERHGSQGTDDIRIRRIRAGQRRPMRFVARLAIDRKVRRVCRR